jgi:hypothetical protein
VHGVIFTSFRDYVSSEHGEEAAEQVFADDPTYLLSEAYPDEHLTRLVEATSALTGADPSSIVHGFGVFTAETTFARLYPAFFAVSGNARDFMLTVETRIHELVRATIRNAGPPQLDIAPFGDDGVTIEYSSPRRLCVLLRGLTEGTARHYGERSSIDETACMHRGDPACRFEVRFSSARTLA